MASAGLVSALFAAAWLIHYAGSLPVAASILVIVALTSFAQPRIGLFIVPAFWPIADLAPWTGQLHFTESDALLLAVGSGIFAHHALRAPTRILHGPLKHSPIGYLLFTAIALSYLLSASRVLWPLPAITPGFWLGYDTPANALRLMKAVPLALTYCACLFIESSVRGKSAVSAVLYGLLAGLVCASLAALSERAAFPGLLNFSTDYRTTAPFWEAHVGGAALDGWLVLTLPVLAWLLQREERPAIAALLLAASALAAYTVLTTFTRTTYFATFIGIAVTLLLAPRRPEAARATTWFGTWPGWLLIQALTTAASISAFSGGGYRGLAALSGTLACVGLAHSALRGASPMQRLIGLLAGLILGTVAAAASLLVAKGPYLFYALTLIATLATLALRRPAPYVLCAVSAQSVMTAWVGWHWGGLDAAATSITAAALALGLASAQSFLRHPIWNGGVAEATRVVCGIGFAALLAVAGGSYYLKERFDALDHDIAHKSEHFREGAALVSTTLDHWIGLGPGQFPSAYFWNLPKAQYPGNITLQSEDGQPFLQIAGPRHVQGFGELFRVTQRAPASVTGPLKVLLTARADRPTSLNVELCRKWLLYEDGCTIGTLKIDGSGHWADYELIVQGKPMDSGHWYAPRLSTLSIIAVGATLLDLRDISVVDWSEGELIRNGRFADGADHWFFTSDRHHLPWHAKNLWIHLWVEHGLLGVGAWALLIAASLGRVAMRFPRRTSAGAIAAGALIGFLALGMVDSLLDIPRLTVMLLVLSYLALASRARTLRHTSTAQTDPSLPAANAQSEPKVSNA